MEQASYQPKGMRQDESFLNFDKNYALENKNIRISTTGLNSKYALTNERGNKKCTLNYVDIDPSKNEENITLEGTVIGEAKVGKYWVIFTTGTFDRIYRLEQTDEDTFEVRLLIEDNLNFDIEHPLETVSYVETENIQKVYWVDGKNQMRLLNIVDPYVLSRDFNIENINAITNLQLKEQVNITKISGGGQWAPGTVQYVCTYINIFGQETNPFYVSPLYYLTKSSNKALSEEDVANCHFNINIRNVDTNYEYVRVYSITRTAQGSQPIVKLVSEIQHSRTEYFTYDNSISDIDDEGQLYMKYDKLNTWNQNDWETTTDEIKKSVIIETTLKDNLSQVDILKNNSDYVTGNSNGDIIRPILISTNSTFQTSYFYNPKDNKFIKREFINDGVNQDGAYEVIISDDDVDTSTSSRLEKHIELIASKIDVLDSSTPLFNFISPIGCSNNWTSNVILTEGNTGMYIPIANTYLDTYGRSIGINSTNISSEDFMYHMLIYGIYKDEHNTPSTGNIYINERQLDPTFYYTKVSIYDEEDEKQYDYYISNAYRFCCRNFKSLKNYNQEEESIYIIDKDIVESINPPGELNASVTIKHYYSENPSDDYYTKLILNDNPNSYQFAIFKKYEQNDSVNLLDTNIGENVDSTYPLYVGGYPITPYTLDHKDGTLFLGNIKVQSAYRTTDQTTEALRTVGVHFNTNDPSLYRQYNVAMSGYTNAYQIANNNNQITHYKTGNTYRFGLQFQHTTGVWSQPVFIGDFEIPASQIKEGNIKFQLPYTKIHKNITEQLLTQDFVSVRPIVVFPEEFQRAIICQGILCPTLYNRQYRNDNQPFAQLSWIPRLRTDGRSHKVIHNTRVGQYEVQGDIFKVPLFADSNDFSDGQLKSTANLFEFNEEEDNQAINDFYSGYSVDINYTMDQQGGSGEITFPEQNGKDYPVKTKGDTTYMIDEQIITMHSPDVAFSDTIRTQALDNSKLRIIGGFNSSNQQDVYMYLQSGSPSPNIKGLIPEDSGFQKPSSFYPYGNWVDYSYIYGDASDVDWTVSTEEELNSNFPKNNYPIHIWQKTGPLNNSHGASNKSAVLERKIYSNVTRLYNPEYIDYTKETIKEEHRIITEPKYCSPDDSVIILDNPNNTSSNNTIIYQGNVNTVLSPSKQYLLSTDLLRYWEVSEHNTYNKIERSNLFAQSPVSMKYKCTPHLVFGLVGSESEGKSMQKILPYRNGETFNSNGYYYDTTIKGYVAQNISEQDTQNSNKPLILIGELKRDIPNIFGGTDEFALNNNSWIVAGDTVKLLADQDASVIWTQGDTYYQRYDCLLAQPYDNNDENQIVSIVSFMCETYINLDGRYDNNRNLVNNTHVTDKNFNLINLNYTQNNNYFTYHILPERELKQTYFPQQFTWTKTKRLGATVDTWANITLASTMDLNGDLGPLRAIRNHNGNLIAFQDRGIALIKYNSNVALETTQGVPVELANSGKVDGTQYISNNVGCKNKWSIAFLKDQLYFIDSANKDLYTFSDKGIVSVSQVAGMESWSSANIDDNIWDLSEDNKSIKVLSDNLNNEILLTSKDFCLAYNQSQDIEAFTSFYDYQGTSFMQQLEGNTYTIKDGNIWRHNAGNYNEFYEKVKPFWTKILVNDKPFQDKIFDVLEFRSDSYKYEENEWKLVSDTFTDLEVENEYQFGSKELDTKSLKRKFRIWRTHIPRDSKNNQKGRIKDRMRNTWLKLTLKGDPSVEAEHNKTVLHDLTVHYT